MPLNRCRYCKQYAFACRCDSQDQEEADPTKVLIGWVVAGVLVVVVIFALF